MDQALVRLRQKPKTSKNQNAPEKKEAKTKSDTAPGNFSDKLFSQEVIDNLESCRTDFRQGDPSGQYSIEKIAGCLEAKKAILRTFIAPVKFRNWYPKCLERPKSILLYGPPGCGKTSIVKAAAADCKLNLFCVSAVTSKFESDEEKARALFAMAKFHSLSIIFFADVDSVMSQRTGQGNESFKSQMVLNVLNDCLASSDFLCTFICATNFVEHLDRAFRDRMEMEIYVGNPDSSAIRAIIANNTKDEANTSGLDLDKLANEMTGLSGRKIIDICEDALYRPIEAKLIDRATGCILSEAAMDRLIAENVYPDPVTMADFYQAIAAAKNQTLAAVPSGLSVD